MLDEEILAEAYEMCLNPLTHEQIIEVLNGCDDVKKQICTFKLASVNNLDEARILVGNLTSQSTIVREAVAIKLNELILSPLPCRELLNEEFLGEYAKGIIDVNPNICRVVIEFLPCLPNQKHLSELIFAKICEVLGVVESATGAKNHIITKKIFNLYWCLEALSVLEESALEVSILDTIIGRSIELNDYTILEKVAKIITKSDNFKTTFGKYVEILRTHENFYVKNYFKK